MKLTPIVLTLLTLFPAAGLFAQLPTNTGAMKVGQLPPGSIALRYENISRPLKDGNTPNPLEMSRYTVALQLELASGVYPWVEVGMNNAKLLSDDANGGFTWGTGVHLRPYLYPLRSDPQLGPRDWLALTLDLALRGGESDSSAGKLDWMSLEGVLGMQWHKKYLGRHNGPIGAYDITAGAGIIFNSTEGKQAGFNGSEEQAMGLRLNTGFTFSKSTYVSVEYDTYGSSSDRLSLLAVFKF